ncbi:MAG: hypothetical protein KDN19_21090 [Verrucomicrobiae bacterium]|nr:hypothetical protein [Verrucomicrobiae bacterium]
MPKGIDKLDWDRVHELSVAIVNASAAGDSTISESRKIELLFVLEELREKYGEHPSLLATIGDYLDQPGDRLKYYRRALQIARSQNFQEEIELIEDSIDELKENADSQE